MKKSLLLIPLMVFAMSVNAADQYPDPSVANSLATAISAVGAGEVVYLDDGTYFNAYGVDYTKPNKNVTIRAIDGKSPVVKLGVPFRISGAASVKFIGIKFDGRDLTPDVGYNYYFRVNSNEDNCLEFENCEFFEIDRYTVYVHNDCKAKLLKFSNCEFYDNANYIITGSASSKTDKCEINNCYFHNNTWIPVYFPASSVSAQQTCSDLRVTNSTFANIDCTPEYRSVIDIKPYGEDITDAIKVVVDHCTFYNNQTINSDHSAIRPYKLSDVTISNCIFAHATSYERRATSCYGGSISNCLTYNLTKDPSKNGHGKYGGDMTLTGNFTADPLFTNAASGDYSFANDWVTPSISPACGAATDGSDLGDPRWYSDPILPSTDFAAPGYFFDGEHALLGGLIRLDASNYIEYYDKQPCGTATWRINATSACALQATLNMESAPNDHNFTIEVTDSEGASVGSVAEASRNSSIGDLELSGRIILPSAGDYTVRLINNQDWSKVVIKGITLMSVGKAFTDIPGTLDPYDANTSSRAYADAGGLYFDPAPESHNIITQWGSWKVRAAATGTFLFTMNVTSDNMQSYMITIFDDEDNVIDMFESVSLGSGDKTLTHYAYLAAGDYTVKVQPTYDWSHGHMVSLVVSTPADLTTLDQAAESNSVISANNGLEKKLQLIRTITGGMYNTICLPFGVEPAKVKEVFGSDVQLMVMSSATIDGEYLYLYFSDVTSSGISAGTPYLIKTSRNIVNPVFAPATISVVEAGSTGGAGFATDYIGTLIKQTIPANENNLFLGADNKLQFSTDAITIKGFRGYFNITTAGAPRRARLVTEEEQVVTELELVGGQLPETFGNKVQKFIDNGQLIIVKDGAHYNAFGIRVK